MISVFESAVVLPAMGFGAWSEAPPHAFHRIVSLGLMVKGGVGGGGLTDTMLGASNTMCALLKGPPEPSGENSHRPAVLRSTGLVLPPVSMYKYFSLGVL